MSAREYLAKQLAPYPLPTKDGGVLRTIGDARAYMWRCRRPAGYAVIGNELPSSFLRKLGWLRSAIRSTSRCSRTARLMLVRSSR
jgi:hypothetical protein